MRIDLYVHTVNAGVDVRVCPSDVPPWATEMLSVLGYIAEKLGRIERKENTIMTSVADVKAKADALLGKVTAETDVVNAVKLVVEHSNDMIATLKQQLADAIAAGADPAQLQALSDTLDAIQAAQSSNADTVAAAVAEGTPVEAS